MDPAKAKPLFKAAALGLEGIKDPWILEHEGAFHMFLSVAVPTPRTGAQSHATLDIFNTGECVSATGLATSTDLEAWQWQGVVFAPGATGWDRYCRRINSVVRVGGKFLAFYDGSAGHHENYEEKTGLASVNGPASLAIPHPGRPAVHQPPPVGFAALSRCAGPGSGGLPLLRIRPARWRP